MLTGRHLFGPTLVLLAALQPLGKAEPPTSAPSGWPRGELIAYPGPWSFALGRSSIILVSDAELRALEDPDARINMSLSTTPHERSLREVCEQAQSAGHRTLIVAFDHFFAQYRPGQGDKPRELTPDRDEYIRLMAGISRFAERCGLGLELSLLSPLEIGPAYARQTGESGVWMHYRKGLRDPKSGQYSVQLWRQRKWANNKGPIELAEAGVRVFAFREHRLPGTSYIAVDPKGIMEITESAQVEVWENSVQPNGCVRIRVHGDGGPEGPDRVLVVQSYRTPEMDYFSERAWPYLTAMLDRYVDAGVQLNALYSDEIHIQQDWAYHNHHDHGAFAVRFVSPGFAKRFAALYGAEYADFAKYLLYFTYAQHDFATDLSARGEVMHVMGTSPEAIRATALLRSRYYHLLQDGVTDLFVRAKRHLENRLGKHLEARAHATWAQSPTCDIWNTAQEHLPPHQYEYTSNFVWSNTVHQAASACADYFRWGDFLTGNGNDHAEGGWLDRNYYGLALACSTGILNAVPNSYAAHWGSPGPVARRHQALEAAFGASAWAPHANVQEMQHRDTEVLMLYPLDLVAVDERFGSWMTQYGYANYITPAKLLERGKVADSALEVAGRRFKTVVALFEPFPSERLLSLLREFADAGGRVIWSGPPPVLTAEGTSALPAWQDLVGADYSPRQTEGEIAPGRMVSFSGSLAEVPPMPILTDFLVDRIYTVAPRAGTETVANCRQRVVGCRRNTPVGGSVSFLGFRPRDDQSGSLGYDARWWFEILSALGAYPGTGRFGDFNDNTERLSRTTPYLVCRFPNGTTALAPHLKDLEESWPGGFARNAEQDKAIAERLQLPSERLTLKDFRANGHLVSYEGDRVVSFRTDAKGRLVAFAGSGATSITIDGETTQFARAALPLVSWAPVPADRRVPGGAILQLLVYGAGQVTIPAPDLPTGCELVMEGSRPGSRGTVVPCRIEDGMLTFEAQAGGGKWLYVVPQATTRSAAE